MWCFSNENTIYRAGPEIPSRLDKSGICETPQKFPECVNIPGISIYLAAAAVIVAAVAAESAAVTAAAAEEQDQNDDPPAVITTKATIVTHKEYLRKFRSGFAAHSKIFPG